LIVAGFSELANKERVVVYRQYASEALENAKVAGNVPSVALYLKIAEQWTKLADFVAARAEDHSE
jgi:hypothetical protein